MSRIKSYLMGGATFACAMGIGYVMQYGLPGQSRPAPEPLRVTGITPTSSAVVMPASEPRITFSRNATPIAAEGPERPMLDAGEALSDRGEQADLACAVTMTAEPAAGAMALLELMAPCHGSERVTLHHQGLMFTEITEADGSLSLTVPVFAQRASFMASFAGGDGAMGRRR